MSAVLDMDESVLGGEPLNVFYVGGGAAVVVVADNSPNPRRQLIPQRAEVQIKGVVAYIHKHRNSPSLQDRRLESRGAGECRNHHFFSAYVDRNQRQVERSPAIGSQHDIIAAQPGTEWRIHRSWPN